MPGPPNRRRRGNQARAKRIAQKKEPKIVENTKRCMFLRGTRASLTVQSLMTDLNLLRKPHTVTMTKKNEIRPFEDASSLEFLSDKNDASLFVFGTHSKKRPDNIVMGRMFNQAVLDMIEFGVEGLKCMADFSGPKPAYGTKPCMLFVGDGFDHDTTLSRCKNLLLDFFRGDEVSDVALATLDHCIVCTAVDSKIYLRVYATVLKKSGTRLPRVELRLIGPAATLAPRRVHWGADGIRKEALRRPKEGKTKKVKNVSYNALGDKEGRIHMERQDLSGLALFHSKALKRPRKRTGPSADADPEEGAEDSQAPGKRHR